MLVKKKRPNSYHNMANKRPRGGKTKVVVGVFDRSGSTDDAAVRQFMREALALYARGVDCLSMLAFVDHRILVVLPLGVHDRKAIEATAVYQVPGGETRLWAAVFEIIQRVHSQVSDADIHVVVATDGEDNASQGKFHGPVGYQHLIAETARLYPTVDLHFNIAVVNDGGDDGGYTDLGRRALVSVVKRADVVSGASSTTLRRFIGAAVTACGGRTQHAIVRVLHVDDPLTVADLKRLPPVLEAKAVEALVDTFDAKWTRANVIGARLVAASTQVWPRRGGSAVPEALRVPFIRALLSILIDGGACAQPESGMLDLPSVHSAESLVVALRDKYPDMFGQLVMALVPVDRAVKSVVARLKPCVVSTPGLISGRKLPVYTIPDPSILVDALAVSTVSNAAQKRRRVSVPALL